MSNFVTTSGTLFDLGLGQQTFHGINCYFLAYCSDESRRAAMLTAKAMGHHVIRCWAFLAIADYVPGQVAFQYGQDGKIMLNEGPTGLVRLDALIQAAGDLDIRLILPLINYWDDLGGMNTWLNWLTPGAPVTEFYRSPILRSAYQDWLTAILTRRNTLTGRLYSEEPAIFAWELTNEARCPTPGGRELLLDWTDTMSQFVKALDANHLLALGDEGFFYKKGSGHLYDGRYGVDWEANLALPAIDFGTYHLYPETWGERHLDFAKRWINDHAEVAARYNKPVLLEEFGLKTADRAVHYQRWRDWVNATNTAGSLVWMLGHNAPDTAGYRDDYVIHGRAGYSTGDSGQGSVMPG